MNEDLRVFQTQFASIMEILLSAAMTETAKLYQSCVLELRAEITRVQAENNTLKCRKIQTAGRAECHLEQNEDWMSEGCHFVRRPLSGRGTTESGFDEVIMQEQQEPKEEAPFIKEEAPDSEELKGICQIPSDVLHTESQMKIIPDPDLNRQWRPPSNATDLKCKNEIQLESSPRPINEEIRIETQDQSCAGAAALQNVFHEGHTSTDWSEHAHFANQQHTSHGKPQAHTCMAPLTPTGNRFTVDISTHYQTEEQSNYNTNSPLPNRPAHTPSIMTGTSTRTLQKTVPSRHLPMSPLPGGSQHRCKDCGKTFHSRRGLCGHLQVHQGERRHQCSQCGKSFLYQSRLMHHLRSHNGKDGYSCRFCQRKFASKANLSVHLVSHTKEHPFQCTVCSLTFGNRAVLHTHLKTHSGEPRYTCTQCGKKFCDLGNFSRHKRIHTGERPYSCEVCGKSFIQSAHLKKHQLTHRRR